MAFDLALGVPKHRVPSVVLDSGLAENGWVTVNPRTLETRYSGVYALGDGANTGTPKAGVFAEGAAKAVASALISKVRSGDPVKENDGVGARCYIEFGGGRIGKGRKWTFFSGPTQADRNLSRRQIRSDCGSTKEKFLLLATRTLVRAVREATCVLNQGLFFADG